MVVYLEQLYHLFYINKRLDYEGYMYREVWNTRLHFRKTKFRQQNTAVKGINALMCVLKHIPNIMDF